MRIEPRIKFPMEREKWNPSFHGHSNMKGSEEAGSKGLQKGNSHKQVCQLEIKPLKAFS